MDNASLVADLISFVADKPRTYGEVMAAWRTSCPRLTIWEDAVDNGFVAVSGDAVKVTRVGASFLRSLAADDANTAQARPRGPQKPAPGGAT